MRQRETRNVWQTYGSVIVVRFTGYFRTVGVCMLGPHIADVETMLDLPFASNVVVSRCLSWLWMGTVRSREGG